MTNNPNELTIENPALVRGQRRGRLQREIFAGATKLEW